MWRNRKKKVKTAVYVVTLIENYVPRRKVRHRLARGDDHPRACANRSEKLSAYVPQINNLWTGATINKKAIEGRLPMRRGKTGVNINKHLYICTFM